MYNILITGSKGQLGQELQFISKSNTNTLYRFFFTSKKDLDISNFKKVEQFIIDNKINSIFNCAAYTAVDKAEDNENTACLINFEAVKNLGELTKKYNITLIHISTDYVFNGKSWMPYTEEKEVAPQSIYGISKLKGEEALKEINPTNTLIIRTAWVYSTFGTNFVKTMLDLGKERDQLNIIYDQVGSPTYARDLANVMLMILPKINSSKIEVYHYSNEGVCSWYDFAKAIFEIKGIDCNVSAIPSSAYPTKARRPHYSVLNKQRIKDQFNITIPYWRDSLKACLNQL